MKSVMRAVVVAALIGVAARAQESPQLNAARSLYASARYDEALGVLDGLRGSESVDLRSVEQYRSLCLLALGRTSEAEGAIAAVIAADPLYRPGDETSPRVRTLFADVRKRMLPEIAASRYAMAKGTYDRQDWPAAQQQFRVLLSLLEEADGTGHLGDLRTLAAGFLELSTRLAAPPPPAAEAAKPDPGPAAEPEASGPAASPVVAGPSRPTPGQVFGSEDTQVSPPIVIRQEIPAVPAVLMSAARGKGLLEIVIDEKGRVISMAMRGSIHPAFDSQVLVAARDWKYQPATLDGQPVRYKKLIQVAVKR